MRGKGLGSQLMESAEKLARENECHFVAMNTMDFEAPGFYQKPGYIIEFQREGFSKNSSMYFLRKNLFSLDSTNQIIQNSNE